MTVRRLRSAWGVGDINVVLPLLLVVAGGIVAASGRIVGFGIIVGALLAMVNSALLVKRVQYAVGSESPGVAMVSMQVGLLLTFLGIGAITLILLVTSVLMAIAMGVTFFVAQTAEILLYYRKRRALDVDRGTSLSGDLG